MTVAPRVLLVAPDIPYPPTGGSRIDMWGQIRLLIEAGCRVSVIVGLTAEMRQARGDDHAAIPGVEAVHVVNRTARWQRIEPRATVNEVQSIVDAWRPDVLLVEYVHFAPLVAALSLQGATVWVRPHNFELMHWWEKSLDHRPWRSGFRATLRWMRQAASMTRTIFAIERQALRFADRVIFIGQADRRWMSRLYGKPSVTQWLPPLVPQAGEMATSFTEPLNVYFAGSEYSSVNSEGASFLVDEIIPAVRRRFPGRFRFHLVGKGSEVMVPRPVDDLIAHGFVDDLAAFLCTMQIACVPARIGWGCKIKVVEAMANGIPVLAAPAAARGVPESDGVQVCRNVDDYVTALGALLETACWQAWASAAVRDYAQWSADASQALVDALPSARQEQDAESCVA